METKNNNVLFDNLFKLTSTPGTPSELYALQRCVKPA